LEFDWARNFVAEPPVSRRAMSQQPSTICYVWKSSQVAILWLSQSTSVAIGEPTVREV
jgi:hypothetical protein